MREVFRILNSESQAGPVALTGEVIFEAVRGASRRKWQKKEIDSSLRRRLIEIREEFSWASYLVIFSPGQKADEVRCQVDIETDGERAGFAIGFGHNPSEAFNDAVERMQWFEKNGPFKMTI